MAPHDCYQGLYSDVETSENNECILDARTQQESLLLGINFLYVDI